MLTNKDELLKKVYEIQNLNQSIVDNIIHAIEYIDKDVQSCLTKSRIVLERILSSIYMNIKHIAPKQNMVGILLNDKEVKEKIPAKIFARMNYIREIANHATHSGDVDFDDSTRVVEDLVFVVKWFADYRINRNNNTVSETVEEVLPRLKQKFPYYIKPEITSVKFIQTTERCYLETTTKVHVVEYLENWMVERSDLGFIIINDEGELMFSPKVSISQNVKTLLNDFDEISIINCTNLFTEEGANDAYQKSLEKNN